MSKCLRIALVIFILALILVMGQSCTGAMAPEDIITRAHWTMNVVGSYRMENHYSMSDNYTERMDDAHIDVDFSAPERYKATIAGGGNLESFIVVGDEYYIYVGRSQFAFDDISYIAFSLVQSLKIESFLSFLEFLKDIEELVGEDNEGSDYYQLSASWDKEKQLEYYSDNLQQQRKDSGLPDFSEEELVEIVEQLSDSLEQITQEYEIWIDKSSYYIKKITMKQKLLSPNGDSVIENVTDAVMEFSMVNGSISIEPPLDEDGEIQPGWIQGTYEQ